jgi:cobalt/nickel transport system ATP-binding protein
VRFALLGSNGAGKSTLFLHLNGTLRPSRGTIRVDGRPIDYGRVGLRHLRQQVGLVFQNSDDQLFAPTVWEDISFGPLNLGLSRAEVERRVEESLEILDLGDLRERATWSLSQGQKRRVAIAGVIAMRPRILILDEPQAGLDAVGTRQLVRLLEEIRQTGVTIMMSTHDLDFVAGWADEVAIIAAGETVCQGAAGAVLADLATLRAAGLTPPLVAEIAVRLHQLGLLEATTPLPMTRERLLDHLESLASWGVRKE